MGALLGEPEGRAPLLGAPKVMKGKLWGWASLFRGAHLGNLDLGSSTGDFEIWLKGALEVGCLSLWEFCEVNLKEGLPCWGP